MTKPDRPKISVVIVTHHRPELLRTALDGVITQRYNGQIEVIVVFDATDPDLSIEMQTPNRSITTMRNSRFAGLAGSRNTGILACSGELVAFCDDDDCWLPGKISAQVDLLDSRPECDVAVTGIFIVAGNRTTVRLPPTESLTHDQFLANRITAAHPSSVVVRRTALVERIGLVDEDTPGSYGEDYEWILRATAIAPVAALQLPLVKVLWGATTYFQDRWQMVADGISYLIERHPDLATNRRGLARLYGHRAFALAAAGHRAQGARLALKSFRLRPNDRRPYLALLVAAGIVDAGKLMRLANRFGAGIV